MASTWQVAKAAKARRTVNAKERQDVFIVKQQESTNALPSIHWISTTKVIERRRKVPLGSSQHEQAAL